MTRIMTEEQALELEEMLLASTVEEVQALRRRLAEGKLDGRQYIDENGYGCIAGSLAAAKLGYDGPRLTGLQISDVLAHPVVDQLLDWHPIEEFSMKLRPGNTPTNNQVAAELDAFIAEHLTRRAVQ